MSLQCESVWLDQHQYESVEARYQAILANRFLGLRVEGKAIATQNPISSEIEKAMNLIGQSLKSNTPSSINTAELEKRVSKLEEENLQIKSTLQDILAKLNKTEARSTSTADEDSDFDLFGSDSKEESSTVDPPTKPVGKAKKPQPVAKSSLILDVKPWDDETDLSAMESNVRSISADGLLWGASKILPIAYGIKKLQISCVIEDDKIGTDFLEESVTAFEDLVQSVDIVAFNKI